MKPRVLFLDHTAALGGAELFLLAVAKKWSATSRVLLFSDGPLARRMEEEAIPVEVLSASRSVMAVTREGRGVEQLAAIPGIAKLALEVARYAKRCDVVFANTQKSWVIGALAASIASKPLICYLHDIITADHFSAVNRRLCVIIGKWFASWVITNSEASKIAYLQCGGRVGSIGVTHNGIDVAEFEKEQASDKYKIRNELDLNDGPVVAVFSRLSPWKGQHILIDALRRLPSVQAIFVGAPLFKDEVRYEEELRKRAKLNGVGDRVRFLGFRDDVPRLMQAADIIVHTSVAPEPFGRVIVEGMLARKPVIATSAGGACEIIRDGLTGRLVAPGDPEILAETIGELLVNEVEAMRLATAGYEEAMKRFSIGSMQSSIEQQINHVLGRDEVSSTDL